MLWSHKKHLQWQLTTWKFKFTPKLPIRVKWTASFNWLPSYLLINKLSNPKLLFILIVDAPNHKEHNLTFIVIDHHRSSWWWHKIAVYKIDRNIYFRHNFFWGSFKTFSGYSSCLVGDQSELLQIIEFSQHRTDLSIWITSAVGLNYCCWVKEDWTLVDLLFFGILEGISNILSFSLTWRISLCRFGK